MPASRFVFVQLASYVLLPNVLELAWVSIRISVSWVCDDRVICCCTLRLLCSISLPRSFPIYTANVCSFFDALKLYMVPCSLFISQQPGLWTDLIDHRPILLMMRKRSLHNNGNHTTLWFQTNGNRSRTPILYKCFLHINGFKKDSHANVCVGINNVFLQPMVYKQLSRTRNGIHYVMGYKQLYRIYHV